MNLLWKFLMLSKDQGITIDSLGQMVETFVAADTLTQVVQTPVTITSPVIYVTTIPGTTLGVD